MYICSSSSVRYWNWYSPVYGEGVPSRVTNSMCMKGSPRLIVMGHLSLLRFTSSRARRPMKPLWTFAAFRKLKPIRPYLLLAVRCATRFGGVKTISWVVMFLCSR